MSFPCIKFFTNPKKLQDTVCLPSFVRDSYVDGCCQLAVGVGDVKSTLSVDGGYGTRRCCAEQFVPWLHMYRLQMGAAPNSTCLH